MKKEKLKGLRSFVIEGRPKTCDQGRGIEITMKWEPVEHIYAVSYPGRYMKSSCRDLEALLNYISENILEIYKAARKAEKKRRKGNGSK